MIISNKGVQRISRLYHEQKQVEKTRRKSKSVSLNDEVELSTEGREIQALLQQVKMADDIRPHVEEIKNSVKSGTYKVSSTQIAAGILRTLK
ncbi:MAG: flagellar biosynthesis anti-sigma factor FlgM [Firmicutes bacterium]|jgi:flagellar biosynthesis anti-sigma factor FlgM|nr:flagellar biosynthesis anti-sigma factor FlgM [Bacillota bacterium]